MPFLRFVICCTHHPPSIPWHLKCLSRRSAVLQVVVCSNHVSAQEEINHALTHELIHAYDHCRAADLDWTNCEHHACSEVRHSFQRLSSWMRCNCLESKFQLVPPYSDPCTACKGSLSHRWHLLLCMAVVGAMSMTVGNLHVAG